VSAPFRFPKFFVTNPSPCPYLPGKVERKVFTELNGRNAGELNEALGRIGFRRSQSVAYRPSCIDCSACVSVRVSPTSSSPARPSASSSAATPTSKSARASRGRPKSNMRCCAAISPQRHPGGGMAEMDEQDFRRHGRADAGPHLCHRISRAVGRRPPRQAGRRLPQRPAGDGLSMIYSFFDVGPTRKGLGTYIILDHIIRAARAGLPYVYLGYWVEGLGAWPTRRASSRSSASAATAGLGLGSIPDHGGASRGTQICRPVRQPRRAQLRLRPQQLPLRGQASIAPPRAPARLPAAHVARNQSYRRRDQPRPDDPSHPSRRRRSPRQLRQARRIPLRDHRMSESGRAAPSGSPMPKRRR
jgi:arginyl-tRNA--protein-N-Asp/Glu arginylyltransferase